MLQEETDPEAVLTANLEKGDIILDKPWLDQFWNQIRQKYGVYMRLLDALPEDKYHSHPVADIRTPAEMVAHTSGSIVRDLAQGVLKGEITANESAESDVASGLTTKAEVLSFATDCWNLGNEAVAAIGDAELSAIVQTPWDMTFPGWVGFDILNDEFLHHRGQLAVYARILGVAPPFIWGFADNSPEFRPSE